MTRKWKLIVTGLFVCFVAAPAMAQRPDVKGSEDHPLISRYPGSVITEYAHKEYDEFTLPLGKIVGTEKVQKTQHLEGKVTRIRYAGPPGRSTLEVLRNYQEALRNAGFETLYTCAKEECGGGIVTLFAAFREALHPAWQSRLVSAKLSRPEGDTYVCLLVDDNFNTAVANRPGVSVYVVEMKPMEAGLVTVNAEALAGDISRTGHVAVYGIYFDTGKADVKPESDAALGEITKLLEQDPKLKLHVVGHTDNVGSMTSNMDLSRRRADAVLKVLTAKHGIGAARLDAQGVGPLAPVASNKTEDGRAKNRRVELVEQ